MRLIVLVLVLGLTASAVLELRQRRLELLNAMAVLHLDMNRHRRAAWDLQHRISSATSPAGLHEKIRDAGPDAAGEAGDAEPPEAFEAIPRDAAAG